MTESCRTVSLVVPEVVVMATYGVTGDHKVDILTTLGFSRLYVDEWDENIVSAFFSKLQALVSMVTCCF